MLDMGFIHDVKKVIAKLPTKRQTLFFSATMPPEIAKLADSILTDPVKVEVAPVSSTADTIDQSIYFVDRTDKNKLLLHLLQGDGIREALVFTRTKHGANKVAKVLDQAGHAAEAIHGNKSQSARQNALKGFKEGKLRVLVATDIAARGIDIDGLTHVINFDLPNIPETYVHRIGRTGRAGALGKAISFCDHEEKEYLRDITRLIKREIPVVNDHPYVLTGGPKKAEPEVRQPRQPRGPGKGQGQRRSQGRGNAPQGQRTEAPAQPMAKRVAAPQRSNTGDPGRRTGGGRNSRRRDERNGRPQQEGRPQGQQQARAERPASQKGDQRGQRQGDRPLGRASRGDGKPREQRTYAGQGSAAPDRKHSPTKPDYAAMTKELFGEENTHGSKQERNEKKKGFLDRLFGR
jgi:ATP-dependent RNA helicase RhlE